MAVQTDRVISELRDLILSGVAQPGERLTELGYAARLGVSRTPLRLAFAELEKEGLLERLKSGGYRVRMFSITDIADAVDVRGVLEGLAARLIAENGLTSETQRSLESAVQQGKKLVDDATMADSQVVDAESWRHLNQRFHTVLAYASGNSALISALEHNNKLPFVGPGSLTLPLVPTRLETAFVARAQSDHEDILEALINREASRAEALMREHAYRSRQNKRKLISEVRSAREKLDGSPVIGLAELAAHAVSA
ncbi:GntR family transcriptional regulator [Allopusillimonas ginsengisoli]|uniref:GntR family transcriptional regulator n=1 Tax=Allopusillimonas ginsengisoli TaxID=453575 RepID=UPI0039C31BB1